MTPTTTNQSDRLLLLLSLLILLSAIPLDVMLPSFPALADHFHTGTGDIALSISIFSIGFSIAQLFVGPLSDRFGRKKLLMIGIIFALAGATGCIFSHNYGAFIAYRIIQSAGCASFVLAQAIVQDAYKGTEGMRTRIFTTTLSGIFIACSPLLGSILQSTLGWQGSFILFAIISLIIIFQVYCQFEETSKTHRGSMRFYGSAYLRILRTRSFLIYSVIGALAFSCHLAFIIVSPAIFIVGLKMSNYEYSIVLMAYGVAYLVGGALASYATNKMETQGQTKLGLLLMTTSGFLMMTMSHYQANASLTVLLPMLICTAGTVFVRPATATEAMNLFDEIAGTAAAAGSTIRFCAAGSISALISVAGNNTILNLCWAIIASSFASVFLFTYLRTTCVTRNPKAKSS
ncbi:multidrug transporter CflA [Cupriavidus sp. SK-4]|uniref:Bcr/CflA family efflux MFS transporter n=1 Tax=Cupriavidus sp. SK-4 TaxID=574750 RepID=UPI00044F1995|nr:Bcr/CflA family efflux MFS transporter [Cupriavidus sp. SK-4]EYS86417.1 multidrug transporter CflA [Cupriavidus sp. SK-4]